MDRLWRWLALRPLPGPETEMTLPRSAADVLSCHVVCEVECTDRIYLNVYVPQLQGQIILFWNASTVDHETVAQVQIGIGSCSRRLRRPSRDPSPDGGRGRFPSGEEPPQN